jgi:hypothetical protein
MKKYQKGFASGSLIVILVIVFLLVGAVSFYYLKFQGKDLPSGLSFIKVQNSPEPEATESSISTSTDLSAIEKELDRTVIDSIDKELDDLDSSASSL